MIYLIGGATRSGKTIITRRLWQEHQVPYFCVDYFISGLQEGAPQLGIIGESPNRLKAPRLWGMIIGMLRNIVEVESAYTVDGDALWPRGVAEFCQEYPGQVRTCFLGYADTNPERKLAEIRQFSGGLNDWIRDHDDAYILDLVREMIEFSAFLREECAAVGIPYIDVSSNFTAGVETAYRMMLGK